VLLARALTVDHRERYLLAFVYSHLGRHDLLRVRTDAEKFLLLAALNLVECVAYVGAQLQSKGTACGRSKWDDWTLTEHLSGTHRLTSRQKSNVDEHQSPGLDLSSPGRKCSTPCA